MKKIHSLAISTALILSLSACETVTDTLVGAYDSVFTTSGEGVSDREAVPGENEDFPKLGTTPDRPDTPEILKQANELQSGLAADNKNAQYTDQMIRSDVENDADDAASASSGVEVAPVPAPIPETPRVTSPKIYTPQDQSSLIFIPKTKPEALPAATPVPEAVTAKTAVVEPVAAPVVEKVAVPAPTTVAEPQAAPKLVEAIEPTLTAAAQDEPLPEWQPAPARYAVAAVAPEVAPIVAPSLTTPAEPYDFQQTIVISGEDPAFSDAPVADLTFYPETSENVVLNQEAVLALSATNVEEQASNGSHIATLYYDRGVSSLTNVDQGVLTQVAALYQENGANSVAVVGHASLPVAPNAANPALVNYKMSLDRANAVVAGLTSLGLSAELITMDAKGANNLVRLGDTAEDHAYNRRTEIYFLN